MDNLLTKRVLYFKDLLAEYPGCSNPIITVKALSGVDIACIIGGAVHFYTTIDHENCLEAFITCDDCYQSAPLRIVKCFCDDEAKCPSCTFCDSKFVCQPKCPDKPCYNDQCIDCDDKYPCPNGQICTNGKCACPVGWKKDAMGICRRCIGDTDCQGCDTCYGFDCVPKTCSTGARVNPKTCECVECYDSSQCTEPNTCCVAGNKCACCPGYYRDPVTGKCEKYPACVTGECPPCMDCINKECKPTTCLPGFVHVGSDCCLQVCDCSKPTCPPGYSCWPVPGQNICVCRSCNVPCGTGGCPEWCDCNGANCVTKKKKCFGYCDENTPCPNGCGCNLAKKECEDCTNKSCVNNDCEKLLGCKCDHQGTGVANLQCIADPCNQPCLSPKDCLGANCTCNQAISQCEDCDRPCENNLDCAFGCYCHKGEKICKKNPCPEGCASGKDCGPGCGCWEDKGCYPCDSFDCVNCPLVQGCACIDGVNCAEKKTDCKEKLTIKSDDANCALIGELETKDCCACPEIGYDFTAALSNTGALTLSAKLRKGYLATSTLLDATGIANDFPPISGTVSMDITANYLDGTSVVFRNDELAEWGGIGANLVSNSFIDSVLCTKPTNNTLQNITITFTTDVNFTFPNGCVFRLPLGTKIKVLGCGKSTNTILKMTRVSGCKKPIFTWKKDNVVFRKVYAQPTGVGSTIYKDTVTGIDGAEVCKNYTLDSDCGCDRTTAYSCYGDETRPTQWAPCNPKDMVITVTPNTCNKQINIAELRTCDAYNGKTFSLYINGKLYSTYLVSAGLIFLSNNIIYPDPITKVELRFPCDACAKCSIIKTLSSVNPCSCSPSPLSLNITGTPTCEGGLNFQITGGEPTYKVVVVRTINGLEHEDETFEYFTNAPITQTINGPMDPGLYTIKVTDKYGCEARDTRTLNCCNLGNITASYDCTNNEIVINRSTTEALQYALNGGLVFFGLNANNRIPSVLTNGTYPDYIQLQKVGDPTCSIKVDLEVNCNNCTLAITQADLNGTCDIVTLTANGVYDQYSINNNTTWVNGTSPINLGTPLTQGNTVRIWIRNSATPTCMDSIDLRCITCATYAVGTATIDHDCLTGAITLLGFNAVPVPAFCVGGVVVIKWKINGIAQPDASLPASFWGGSIEIATGRTLGFGVNNIEAEIFLNCPGGTPCSIATLNGAIVIPDTLINVIYNCDPPSQGVQWSGAPIGPVQINLAGVWTNINLGYLIANAGTYLIRDSGAGIYCAPAKSLTVPNCGGGNPPGGTTCEQAANLLQIADACNGNVTVVNGYAAPVNVTLQIRDNQAGTCSGNVIFSILKSNLASGASHTFTGVLLSNGTKTFLVQTLGAGDGCTACKAGQICASGPCSLTATPVLACVPGTSGNIKVQVTNNNLVAVAVYLDNILRVTSLGAGATTTIANQVPIGSHTVKFVCLTDVTVFNTTTQNFNC